MTSRSQAKMASPSKLPAAMRLAIQAVMDMRVRTRCAYKLESLSDECLPASGAAWMPFRWWIYTVSAYAD
jgi:hypothetical protein